MMFFKANNLQKYEIFTWKLKVHSTMCVSVAMQNNDQTINICSLDKYM